MTTATTTPWAPPANDDTTSSLELLGAQQKGEAFLAWSRYVGAERVFRAVSEDDPELDRRFLDEGTMPRRLWPSWWT